MTPEWSVAYTGLGLADIALVVIWGSFLVCLVIAARRGRH